MVIQDNTTVSTAATKPKKCSECGHMNPHNRTTCRKCKAVLPDNVASLRCPECGNEVKVDAEKCGYCGLGIEEVKSRTQFKM